MNFQSSLVCAGLIAGSALALSAGSAEANLGQFDFVGSPIGGGLTTLDASNPGPLLSFEPDFSNIIGAGTLWLEGFTAGTIYDTNGTDTTGPDTPKGDIFIDLGTDLTDTTDGLNVVTLKSIDEILVTSGDAGSLVTALSVNFDGHFLVDPNDPSQGVFGADGVLTFQVAGTADEVQEILDSGGIIEGMSFSGMFLKVEKVPESSPTAGLIGLGLVGGLAAVARKRKQRLIK